MAFPIHANEVGGFVNQIREQVVLTREQREARADAIRSLAMLKVVAVVVTVVLTTIFAIFPKIFTFIPLALAAYVTYEIFVVNRNLREIFNNAILEAQIGLNPSSFQNHLTKKAPLASLLADLVPLEPEDIHRFGL